jgi:hypothetical protein
VPTESVLNARRQSRHMLLLFGEFFTASNSVLRETKLVLVRCITATAESKLQLTM